MRYALTLLFATIFPLFATAQSLHIKAGGGLATQMGKNAAGERARTVGAYKLGVGYEFEFSQRWTFLPTLQYVGKGWAENDHTVPVLDEATGEVAVNEITGEPLQSLLHRNTSAHYLELPLLFHYYHHLAPSRYLTFAVGPYVGVGLAGKQKTKGDATQSGAQRFYYDEALFGLPGARRWEYGVQALAGMQLPSHITIALEASYALPRFQSAGRRNFTALLSLSYALRVKE